ncbi:MAG: bifunctional UDP-N-acetylmuramoyl-tripeptide:D-alanyl-D-alanine ligase/alanine racemase [Bacteroidales bacterium]|nr:bifunctional UDP-N-acetylmuramoyl-tripeptide:D-alanyl-D-alanine ligase/alanine racemase [Bacteroidales bacterium]
MKASEINLTIQHTGARIVNPDAEVVSLLTDSRKAGSPEGALFFAIPTKRNNGVRFVPALYDAGVRNFVVPTADADGLLGCCRDANVWIVDDVVLALQQVAAARRRQHRIPVVGITGSNGKTIVKDWIVQLLAGDRRVVASPKSYNSQIGVPLSVWQLADDSEMGVFEAGISEAGEMERLREVIEPTIGIFTNIGAAHDENFADRRQKIDEKLRLFVHCDSLIYCSDYKDIDSAVKESSELRGVQRFTWGHSADDAVQLVDVQVGTDGSVLTVRRGGETVQVRIPFVDRASVENAMHCVSFLFLQGYSGALIAERCARLAPVAMRMELMEGVNNCLIVNDGYSLDLNSLAIALDFVHHEQQHTSKTLIVSDMLQTGVPEAELYRRVAELAGQRGIRRLIGIGEAIARNSEAFSGMDAAFYPTTEDFMQHCNLASFQNETVLIKGARMFRFERIAKLLQRKLHETVMEVNLDALVRNLNYYRSLLRPCTKLMAMVKASSYGAGMVEVANRLQYNHVDYLTVAYCDEGVELRRNGISLPVMVMNPEEACFDNIIQYGLEPVIYSFRTLDAFSQAAALYKDRGAKIPIHVEFDTGMHRLGFSGDDVDELADRLSREDCPLRVCSIFSHLACSDDPSMDDFTNRQISLFRQWNGALRQRLGQDDICCHILNSSGIARFPEAQMDMVRLGIGLYGYAPEPDVQAHLAPVSRLKTRISQIKHIAAGDSVGYGRHWVAQVDSRIAIIPIGYADGLCRRLGQGRGRVSVAGREVPIIGNICMDMCFLDVTGVDCCEGDEVVVFGDVHLMQQMSQAAGTIPYEILTSVSPRVKRVYYSE